MAVQTPSTYNPEAVNLVIDGVPLDGGKAEDGITINRDATSEITEGMDSGVTFEWHPGRVAQVNVTMRAASNGAGLLHNIQTSVINDLRNGLAHPNITGIARDPVNGSGISAPNVFFLNEPFVDLAMKSGTVEFQLAFVNYENKIASNLA